MMIEYMIIMHTELQAWSCESIFLAIRRRRRCFSVSLKRLLSLSWCSRSTIILRSSSRRSYKREDLSSAESSITRNGSRELIGAMYRLHPVSTLRCSRLTRQVQVPIVKLWIRKTCSISPPQCAHSRGEQLQNYDISRVTLTRVCEMDSRPDLKTLQIYN